MNQSSLIFPPPQGQPARLRSRPAPHLFRCIPAARLHCAAVSALEAPGPEPISSPAPAAATARRPWWIPPFLGAIPAISDGQLRLLGAVALALFFDQYDLGLLTSALPRIRAELGMAEADLGSHLGAVRLGALPAFFLLPLADRIGRRRLFLLSMVGLSLATGLTAFTQTADQFVALQMISRLFMTSGMSVAFVIVTEEFPAEHRGWGLGMLGALGSCGIGLGAGLFALVDVLPFGWRALYAMGFAPLLLFPFFRRGIPETARFQRHRDAADHASSSGFVQWMRDVHGYARAHPVRVALLAAMAVASSFGTMSVFQFTSLFVMDVHGWEPWQFGTMTIAGGAIGIGGSIVAGRLGDRIGRRRVGFAAAIAFPIFASIFYHGSSWMLPFAWVVFVFCAQAMGTMQRAFVTELFPTALRGSAMGVAEVLSTLGASAGLFVLGLGTQEPGSLADVTSMLSATVAIAGGIMLLLPETRARELESIG